MNRQETIQVVNQFVDEYEKWAELQNSNDATMSFFKSTFINNMGSNVYGEFCKNTRDQVYWLNRCSKFFEEKFRTVMPESLSYKLFLINLAHYK